MNVPAHLKTAAVVSISVMGISAAILPTQALPTEREVPYLSSGVIHIDYECDSSKIDANFKSDAYAAVLFNNINIDGANMSHEAVETLNNYLKDYDSVGFVTAHCHPESTWQLLFTAMKSVGKGISAVVTMYVLQITVSPLESPRMVILATARVR